MNNIFVNLLHIYQSYGYDTRLYRKTLSSNPKQIYYGASRQKIDRTIKACLLFLLARVQYLILLYTVYLNLKTFLIPIIAFILLLFLFPFYLIISNYFITPFQRIHLSILTRRAKKKLAMMQDLIIIGIAGSYGKTTQKEILTHILSTKYNVLSTIGNQNTCIGIATCILEKLNATYQVFIVEMGEEHLGDIQKLCDLVHPTIGIVTGVTRQHMDTFRSYDELVTTIGELFSGVGATGKIYMQKRFLEFESYLTNSTATIPTPPSQINYEENFAGISFIYKERLCHVKLLAKHTVYPILIAREIANSLGIEDVDIAKSLTTLDHVPHRLAPIYNPGTNIWVIDDTYNGNIEGFKSGIDLLQNCHVSGKKRYITPGLLNIGSNAKEIHFTLGTLLASATDNVILIQNKNTRAIEAGLLNGGFQKENIHLFTDAAIAHSKLSILLGNGDVILFQNDIPDLLL